MRSIFLLISLFLAVLVFAQPSPINRRAMVLAGLAPQVPQEFVNSLNLNITSRWISASLPTNNAVSDWIDETNHFHLLQLAGANQPTNGSTPLTGVRFDLNKFLGCTNTFDAGNAYVWFVLNFDGDLSKGFQAIFSDTNNNLVEIVHGVNWSLTAGNFIYSPPMPTGLHDILLFSPNAWLDGQQMTAGGGATWYSLDKIWQLGQSTISADRLIGYIPEIIIFTNTSGVGVSITASNLHHYRTNHYGGSP